MKSTLVIFISFISFYQLYGQTLGDMFQKSIDSIYQANPGSNGIMVHVESPDYNVSWSGAAGYSDKNIKTRLEPDQPALIASCTKTYVSASILRLVEEEKIGINQSIKELISTKSRKLFESDGYILDSITIAQLLSHTGGIVDFADQEYLEYCINNPKHRWTRDEQLERAIKVGDPLAKPGKTYKYADTNYLLLTEIIENLTGKPFYAAMRELLRYELLKLNNTWFLSLEDEPTGIKQMVQQNFGDFNSLQFDASVDLYGGGGIACTTKDLALFSYNLFNAKIVRDPAVLNLIFTHDSIQIQNIDSIRNKYYLGLMSEEYRGLVAYGHLGYWGTAFFHLPELNTSVSIFVLERSKRILREDIINQIIGILTD